MARDVERDPEGVPPMAAQETAVDVLLHAAHLAIDADLPDLFQQHADLLEVSDPVAYLVDLQQRGLIPFLTLVSPERHAEPLGVDSTLPGRAFQLVQVLTQPATSADGVDGADGEPLRVWLPLLDGTERLGVLGVTVPSQDAWEADGGVLQTRLLRFAALAAELIMTKTMYGDTLVRLRRTAKMGLAAEMQWSSLPPLTFASADLTVAGGLEPAYEVAGDTLDYAVDHEVLRFALFDGMGHGLESAQLATLTVAAYRNARRNQRSLARTVAEMDAAVSERFQDAFVTGHVAELDLDSGILSWVNCGHPDPLLIRDGQLVRRLYVPPRPPLGLSALNPHVSGVGEVRLQPGDLLVLYSDGVIEARSPEGEYFGVDRLIDLLIRNVAAELPAPETVRRVIRALLEHQQDQLADDATIMMVHHRPANQQALLPTL